MKLRLSRAHFPVTVLGPGRRIGVWFQGCSIHCAGCLARDTWVSSAEHDVDLATLLAWCREITASTGFDGVTISGGEPFEQPAALAALLDGLVAWRAERPVPFDILCYSGFPLRVLERDHAEILGRLDILVPEPFVEARERRRWRGSANQPLMGRTALGRERIDVARGEVAPDRPIDELQVVVAGDRAYTVGIPGRGDLERLRARAGEHGVHFGGVSWLA